MRQDKGASASRPGSREPSREGVSAASGFDPSRGDKPKRVLVCGGRFYDLRSHVYEVLDNLDPEIVIQGGASGADGIAADWAESNSALLSFSADWQRHGKAAGPIRNQRMLDEGRPDLVVAFPGGRGTDDMIRRARAAGVWVLDLRDSDGSPKGRDAQRLDGEAATARAAEGGIAREEPS